MTEKQRLTIGMACVDDFDGVYFTITSLMLHHALAMKGVEIVVVDNRPESKQGKAVAAWVTNRVPQGRYVAFHGDSGTAQPRNQVFRQAASDYVLCIDCHVLLAPNALDRLHQHFANQSDSIDLLTGPLLNDSGTIAATHQRPEWGSGAWGKWSIDPKGANPDAEPFEIWQQGMGLFACRKQAWVQFHPDFRGFGGCESYIMEKFRQRGGRVLCCPWLRWTHRFGRPNGVPYTLDTQQRIRNYVIGFEELGLDTAPVYEHFNVPPAVVDRGKQPRDSVIAKSTLAIVGHRGLGSVQMRGRTLEQHFQSRFVHSSDVDAMDHVETVIATKNGFCGKTLRQRCDRLIYDPLDAFVDCGTIKDPVQYWRTQYNTMKFDDIIATSPAAMATMRQALPNDVGIHLVPHQCDPRVRLGWRNPEGPIVYSGLKRFVQSRLPVIEEACSKLGRELRLGGNVETLRDAAAVLSLRLAPYDSPIYRHCKPQIKLENAVAAGIPVVSTDCPAARTLHPTIPTVRADFTAAELASALQAALLAGPPAKAFNQSDYFNAIQRILNLPRITVFTAVFGEHETLREPENKVAGVQYICFTDNPYLRSNAWQIHYCPPSGSPLMQAKRIKILAHTVVDCEISVWFDASLTVLDVTSALEGFDGDIALRKHPARTCAYEEAAHVRIQHRGDPTRIDAVVERYSKEGHPREYGLWCGGIILRRHNDRTKAFNETWWHEVETGSARDQISLPVVLRRTGIKMQTIRKPGLLYRSGSL